MRDIHYQDIRCTACKRDGIAYSECFNKGHNDSVRTLKQALGTKITKNGHKEGCPGASGSPACVCNKG